MTMVASDLQTHPHQRSPAGAHDRALSEAEFLHVKYGDLQAGGWGPRLRARFGHVTPDDRYEYVVSQRVTPGTDWLDVGCGRFLFPHNKAMAKTLAERCGSLTGIDPSDNLFENELLDHREQCLLQDYKPSRRYDLVTLRMVVEHITDPAGAASALADLVRPGGHVIIYTVNKLSPISLLSAVTPTSLHLKVKRKLWGGEDKDTFPTVYKMNTRRDLAKLLAVAGFVEDAFEYLADTRVSAHYRLWNILELTTWRLLGRLGVMYPENCLLGVYRRTGA